MNIEQKYVELANDLHDAIKGMHRSLSELKKPNLTSDNYKEISGRIERFITKCATIHLEVKKINLTKEKMLELFQQTKYKKESA